MHCMNNYNQGLTFYHPLGIFMPLYDFYNALHKCFK